MDDLIKMYSKTRDMLIAELDELHKHLSWSGQGERGPIMIRIDDLEKMLAGIETKLETLQNPAKGIQLAKTKIFIFSGSISDIKKKLSAEDFRRLPADVYASHASDWRPFCKEISKIKDLILRLKDQGYVFDEHYLEDDFKIEILELIEEDFKKNILIIDLLAFTDQNREMAKTFDRKEGCPVLIPIDSDLDEKLRNMMKKKRIGAFRYLERSFLSCSFYHNEVPHSSYFLREMANLINRNTPPSASLISGQSNQLIPLVFRPTF